MLLLPNFLKLLDFSEIWREKIVNTIHSITIAIAAAKPGSDSSFDITGDSGKSVITIVVYKILYWGSS